MFSNQDINVKPNKEINIYLHLFVKIHAKRYIISFYFMRKISVCHLQFQAKSEFSQCKFVKNVWEI